tara:strand:+ start:2199 stop:2990 length:792 start_codon:yes stop_codon:yes gene_type:complete
MGDLSNLKISNTYSRLLQADPDTNQLQDGVGNNPLSITFNGTTLKYVDGNQQNNYILTSDANGIARWAENSGGGGGDTNVYWSASSVDGKFIVNSGMTNSKVGIGTTIPNHELSVSGTISASSSIITTNITGTLQTAAQTNITSVGTLTSLSVNGAISASTGGGFRFQSDPDTGIYSEAADAIVITTGDDDGITIDTNQVQINKELEVGSNLVVTGNTVMNGTLSATTSCKIGNGNGVVSAATINAVTINGTTVEGTIDGGTF